MFRIICLVIGYAFGLFQTSYIYGRMHGIDIREHGSGNAGTTNMMRTMGTKAGLVTFVGDLAKTFAAIWICVLIFHNSHPDLIPLIKCYAGAGAILGHDFPFYLKFKGGKGIACTAAFVISLDPVMTIVGIIVFFSIFFATHYVSLGSVMVYVTLMIEFILFGHYRLFLFKDAPDTASVIETCCVAGFLAILAIYKHRENIKRLIKGTEKKTYLKNKDPEIKEVDK